MDCSKPRPGGKEEVRYETEFRAGLTSADPVRGVVLSNDDPAVRELNALFGDHTFFLDRNGLNVVESNEDAQAGAPEGTVVNLASWTDEGWVWCPMNPNQRKSSSCLRRGTD